MPQPVTPAEFKAAKPQFSSVEDPTVQAYLDLAALWVDESWPERLYRPATMAAACHLMTLDGLGSDQESRAYFQGAAQFQSIKSGNVTLTRYAASANGAGHTFGDWLYSTSCGRFLLQLMRMQFGGPRVAMGNSGSGLSSGYAKDWPRIFWDS